MSEFARRLEAEIPRLRRYARALTRDVARADDLVQSCLLRAIDKQELWERGTDLRAWLLTILHNQHVNEVRRSMREGSAIALDEDLLPTVTPNAFASLQLRDLERAIAALRDEERAVILLVGLEGLIYEDVAKILGVPVGTVRSRLSRGRQHLREMLDMSEEPQRRSRPADGDQKHSYRGALPGNKQGITLPLSAPSWNARPDAIVALKDAGEGGAPHRATAAAIPVS
jgi:RNA polymerase sigma-70 factor (ECF subfamily)